MNKVIAQNPRYRTAFRIFLTVFLTIAVFLVYLQGNRLDDPFLNLTEMVYGTAHRPYVYRVLLPLLIRLIEAITPLSIKFIAASLMYLSLLGFVFSFRFLLMAFYQESPYVDILPLFAIFGLVPFMFGARNLYDFAVLFLFTLGLALLARRKWQLFLFVYVLACLNKETTILLTFVYVLHFYHKLDRLRFFRLLVFQLFIYFVIRLFLIWHFADNPGGLVQFHLHRHIPIMMAHPALSISYLIFGFILAWLVFRQLRQKPHFLRNAVIAIIPPLLVLYFLFGFPFEIRIFYEAYPIVFLLAIWPFIPPSTAAFYVEDFVT